MVEQCTSHHLEPETTCQPMCVHPQSYQCPICTATQHVEIENHRNFPFLFPKSKNQLVHHSRNHQQHQLYAWPTYDELRDHVESLFGSVIENLTLHRMKKYFFCFYHLVEKIRSFPTMYNTWGCLWGQIDETKHFLQKSGLKTPILAATVLDHPTSKRAETHNVRCFSFKKKNHP